MKKSTQFSFRRLIKLVRNEIFTNYRFWLTAIGAVAGVWVILYLLNARSGGGYGFHSTWYALILFVGGFLLSSNAFQEVQTAPRGYTYLLLPASLLEKFVSKLLVTSVGYALVTGLLYTLLSILAKLLATLLFGQSLPVFNLLDASVIKMMGVYCILQSIFLFASIYFRRHAFTKIVLAGFALLFVYSLVLMFFVRVIYSPYFNGMHWGKTMLHLDYWELPSIFLGLVAVVKWSFYLLLAPYFWLLAYLRLKETEV